MKLRVRFLAALFALLALSLGWVEGAWALACSPEMGAESVATAPASAGTGGMDMDCPAPAGTSHSDDSGTDPDRPKAPHCPFGPAAAGGACAIAPPLPGEARVAIAPSPEGALLLVAPDPMRDLLSVSAFFRPPRA